MIIIATLMKLLDTRIVANNMFGFSRCFIIICERAVLVRDILFFSLGERLKKATSLADTSADKQINIIKDTIPKIVTSIDGKFDARIVKKYLWGSGSKA
jgi:hypothetical protein